MVYNYEANQMSLILDNLPSAGKRQDLSLRVAFLILPQY